jgi:hypothetical protein
MNERTLVTHPILLFSSGKIELYHLHTFPFLKSRQIRFYSSSAEFPHTLYLGCYCYKQAKSCSDEQRSEKYMESRIIVLPQGKEPKTRLAFLVVVQSVKKTTCSHISA